MKVENPNFDGAVVASKAVSDGGAVVAGGTLGTALGGLLVASLRGRGLSPWPEGMDIVAVGVAATLFGSVVAGLKRARRNIKKHKYLPLLVVGGLLLGGLSGCETLTLSDGTVVQRLDTAALRELYLELTREEEKSPSSHVVVEVDGVAVDLDAVKAELRNRGIQVKAD